MSINNKPTSIRMKAELKERALKEAHKNGLELSAWIRMICAKELNKIQEQKNK